MAALPFLLAPTISGALEVPGYNGFAVGLGLTWCIYTHTLGTETDPEGTKNNEKDLGILREWNT